jgi:hypothetical protein
MGVSCVTITIEEFERLIKAKKKFDKIVDLKNSNLMSIRETNRIAKRAVIDGDMETVGKLVLEQDKKNLIYMAKIVEVLESEDE